MRLLAVVVFGVAGAVSAGALAATTIGPKTACPGVRAAPVSAPNLKAALARHEPAIVVAMGSSTTRGWQSSDPAHSYPAVLQDRLSHMLVHAHIAVINRGVNGEDAAEEVARMEADVVAIHPQLVVWQVGANGALRSVDPVVFRKLVAAGAARLHQAGADVVLMDNQRSPRILAAPENAAIDQSLAEVAEQTDASLFDRGALMDGWAKAGSPYSAFISADNLHHNDLGYQCLAEAVAESIVAGLGTEEPGARGPGSQSASAR